MSYLEFYYGVMCLPMTVTMDTLVALHYYHNGCDVIFLPTHLVVQVWLWPLNFDINYRLEAGELEKKKF